MEKRDTTIEYRNRDCYLDKLETKQKKYKYANREGEMNKKEAVRNLTASVVGVAGLELAASTSLR